MPSGLSDCLVPETNGVDDVVAVGSGFTVYPNPSTGHLTLVTKAGSYTDMVICNSIGASVFTTKIENNTIDIDLNRASGVYFVKCNNANTGVSEVKSFVMQ